MQVGGIGNSGLSGHSSSHHVTSCIHEHHTDKEKTGGMRASSSALSKLAVEQIQEQRLSLIDMLRNTITGGRRLLGRLWGAETGGSAAPAVQAPPDGSQERVTGAEPVVAPDRDAASHAGVLAASMAVPYPQSQANPYFTTASGPDRASESLLHRVRIRFRDAAGSLAKRFGGRMGERLEGRFSGKNALNPGGGKAKGNLRKRSRYKGVDEEIDCVLTDDSYLMDSYDRKGAYTRLTTEHKQ